MRIEQVVDPRVVMLTKTPSDSDFAPISFAAEIIAILEPRLPNISPMERVMLAEAYFDVGRNSAGVEQWERAFTKSKEFDTAVAHANFGSRLLKNGQKAAGVRKKRSPLAMFRTLLRSESR